MTGTDLAVDDVIEALDRFYCHNVVVSLWADAVANRLEGMAIYLLSDEAQGGRRTGARALTSSSGRTRRSSTRRGDGMT